ncbi:hypothetical protein KC19_11G016500 [Ceratodon purpureus]|uniref:Cytochrome P450 n=1 Tax=Ceratodon purpureus TaxID=3225 RepID=A0A8T0GFL2_CERPU|nr:hypothetical protein KC19_11G016500 [Ceratodon purpureus]
MELDRLSRVFDPKRVEEMFDVGDVDRVLVVTTLLICFSAWLWWYVFWTQRNRPGPYEFPVIGLLIQAQANWHRLHDYITDYLYNVDTLRVNIGFGFMAVMTADPANIEYIMKTNFNNYPKGPRLISINQDFFGQGIFNADGDLWIHQRKVAAIEFNSIRLRNFNTPIFNDFGIRLVHRLMEKSMSKSQIDLQELMSRMTLDTTVRIAFGVDLGSLAPTLPHVPVGKSYETASTCSFTRFSHPFWKVEKFFQFGQEKRLKKAVADLDAFAYDVIQKRKKELPDGKFMEQVNEEKDDLLSRFVKMSKQGDNRFGDRALRDIMVNYILAGRDSTSAVICWTMYMLVLNPEALSKVRQELAELMQKQSPPRDWDHLSEEKAIEAFAELLTFDNVGSLTYLHATITETMRLYPPVPLNTKEAVADDILPSGQIVRKGDAVVFHPYGMGRMPYIWGPDAADFKPERWIKDGVFQPESPFKYIAFQGGPRLCLGKDSSYLQMKITVALLTQFFDFKLVPGHRYRYKVMISLIFDDGLPVTVHKRKK